uniref:Uncharacterized protein n=1 Tax=Ananas comosus var. bracteatus TaxID=296719 RepID=A0A6V7NSX8_ANACO|nr:unnamed protein product [Ananas comosus var. bracteatus]
MKLVPMLMTALELDPSGSPTGNDPPGHTGSTYPDSASTAAGNDDHRRSRSSEPGDDQILHAVQMSHVLATGPGSWDLRPSGKTGGVGGRTHWELYLYSSHPVWFWGTGTHRGEPSEDRGKGIAP